MLRTENRICFQTYTINRSALLKPKNGMKIKQKPKTAHKEYKNPKTEINWTPPPPSSFLSHQPLTVFYYIHEWGKVT